MKVKERETARALRKKGMSMNQIIAKTGFSKASVSFWTRDIILTEKQKGKISQRGRSMDSIERRRVSRMLNIANKRQEIINSAKNDFKNISSRELKLVGAMLYWGEGRKTGNWTVSVANSDPLVIKVMMKFFREVCKVPEGKFRGHIHAFENTPVKKAEEYWSGVSGIPLKQFFKTYIKNSTASLQKRNTLPYGTLDVCVSDTKLFLTIKGWIAGIAEVSLKT